MKTDPKQTTLINGDESRLKDDLTTELYNQMPLYAETSAITKAAQKWKDLWVRILDTLSV